MIRLLLALALSLGITASANAKTRVLLFGVSEYPHLPAEKSLSAPRNDVARMRDTLLARGIEAADITILADGVEGSSGAPTRAAILERFQFLADHADKGDFIVIFGSGHGSRQKSRSGHKLDGLDQLFLPRDIEPDPTAASGGPFRNAIVSTEFGARLDMIRRKGADVLFMLDSCFSGSASRAAGDGVHDKMVDPADIGLSVATALAPESMPLAEMPALPPGSGRLIALYASQPNETAREVALPANAPLAKRSWGSIFTLAITRTLQGAQAMSYRQLMVEAGRLLRADATLKAQQTPSYEGDGLDLPVFGSAQPANFAWRVHDGVLHAGQLEGVEEKTLVALYDSVDVTRSKPIGIGRVVNAAPLQAALAVLRAGCDPIKTECPIDDKNPALKKAIYAKVLKPVAGTTLRITALRERAGAPPPTPDAMARARDALAAVLDGALKGKVEIDEGAPDLASWMDRDGIRLMPIALEPGRMEAGPSVPFPIGADAEVLQSALARALLRAREIIRLQQMDAMLANGGRRELAVTTETRRYAMNPANKQCAFAAGDSGTLVDEGQPIEICNKLVVTLENQGSRAVMPAVFFLDDAWNLIARRPSCPVGLTVADRLEPGRRLSFEVPYQPRAFKPGLAPTTTNGVFVVGVPFREGETELPNFCGLQAFNDTAGQSTRGADDDGDLDHLLSGTTRGGARLALETASMTLTFWTVKQPLKP